MSMLRNNHIHITLDLDRAGGALLADLLLRRREAAIGRRTAVTEAASEKKTKAVSTTFTRSNETDGAYVTSQ